MPDTEKLKSESIMNIIDLIKRRDIRIPNYQRPYEWTSKNIVELLDDISTSTYQYRIGTILLHNNSDKGWYDIVDGQQRVLSTLLIYSCLGGSDCTLLNNLTFTHKLTQNNIYHNYRFIEQWFALKSKEEKDEFKDKLEKNIEVVVIIVNNEREAFQLFDSQNSRGKALYPHDLLKAYHLREMLSSPSEMKHAVENWEAKDPVDIRNLFYDHLFPIYNWSIGHCGDTFSDKYIDFYKGADIKDSYTYALRTFKASPCFQINEPFIAGHDFFKFVDHYIGLLENLKTDMEELDIDILKKIDWIGEKSSEKEYCAILNAPSNRYCKVLFLNALMCYYDRFHRLDKLAVIRLFTWAYMIRVDMSSLGYDTIRKYAIGEYNSQYTNKIAMFSKIVNARRHTDISNITIEMSTRVDQKGNHLKEKRKNLLEKLKCLNGISNYETDDK
jgi:hypothetical protein